MPYQSILTRAQYKKSVQIKIFRHHHHQLNYPSQDLGSKICFANNSTTSHPIQKQTEDSESSLLVLPNNVFKKIHLNFLMLINAFTIITKNPSVINDT